MIASNSALPPFVKWAGGKRAIIPRIQELWHSHSHQWNSHSCRRLVDLSAGSGAIALGIRPRTAILNDVNPHLINLFRQVQAGFTMDGFDCTNTQGAYLEKRDRFNALIQSGECQALEAAQLFYYLLRHCFNGLCRFNGKGLFNVGWGKYESVSLVKDWGTYQEAIASYTFTCGDFSQVRLEPEDFVIADPPYDSDRGFTSYYGSFRWEDQLRFADFLADHSAPVVAFNAATDRIIELYRDRGFSIQHTQERRSISGNGDRASAPCVLLTKNIKRGL